MMAISNPEVKAKSVDVGSSCKSFERSLFTTHLEIECTAPVHFDRTSGYEQRKDNRHPCCGSTTRNAYLSAITNDDTQKSTSDKQLR
ncbi:hypothetical protein CSKR_110610 [Clonorchis sinensis]|uniref:Uncharacterized protein n=1 Tax=Clonorchis sinensis TaxID=79923 RepID=A0A419PKT9_CLOSI|nr:hypothetical protein CSKR_110610 [Clonorchis sinensis]